MLVHLRVQNMALIDEAEMDLGEGLNVLTGETGAGKSIILGAINLALGGRGHKDMLRDPSRPATVDLLFEEEKPAVRKRLEEMGIEVSDGEILLSRRFTASGRSTCQINQTMVTTAQVKQVAALLIDIHGQHEHQSLLDSSRHIDILDAFIPSIAALRQQMKEMCEEEAQLKKQWQHYAENGSDRERLLALMQFELDEIEQAGWQEGEEEALGEERKRLMYSGRLQESSMKAYELLRGESSRGQSAVEAMEDALHLLREAQRLDETFFAPYADSLEEQIAVTEDMARDLRSYGEELESQPERLMQVEERLDQLQHLKTKYGSSRQQVMAYYNKTKAEQERMRNWQETVRQLEEQMAAQQQKMIKLAARMTKLRTEAGDRIGKQITEVLASLQFHDPVFQVAIQPKELSPKGADQVIFMIRTNVGEALQPLHLIASGGEMSRVMLAIKTILAKQDAIGTLIFDEIDTGISGRTAQSVAEKMSRIALYHQVICVTHLPQIAALADCHMRIEKTVEGTHTATRVQQLTQPQITEELARMLGGTQITQAVLDNAAEMKKLADRWKAEKRSQTA